MEEDPGIDAVITVVRRRKPSALLAAALTLAAVAALLAISPSPAAAACTPVNACGRLIVEIKIVGPVETPGPTETKFNFTADFAATVIGSPDATPNAFTLAARQLQTVEDIRPGTHILKESNVPTLSGYDLTDVTCVESGGSSNTVTTTSIGPGTAPLGQTPPQVGTATLRVDADERIICTYTNTRRGRIVIAKDTLPDLDLTEFAFTTNVPRYERFAIGDNESLSIDIAPGTYTVTEDLMPGWELYELTCDPEVPYLLPRERSVDLGTRTATLDIKPGKSTTCRFKNRLTARLVVQKRTLPGPDSASFDFETTASEDTFSLSDGDREVFDIEPGEHTVTESRRDGWELTGLSCDDPSSTTDEAERTATVDVSRGETVTCTFTNSKTGTVVLAAQTIPADDPTLFDYTTTARGLPAFKLAGGDSERRVVSPGTYTARQGSAIGFRLDSVSCDDVDSTGGTPTRTASLHVDAGETVTCTFVNRAIASTVAVKSAGQEYAYVGDALDLTFSVTNPGQSPLRDVQVADDGCAPVTVKQKRAGGGGADETPNVLDLSDTWVYECSMTAPAQGGAPRFAARAGPLLNTVRVDASDEFARSVSASDRHTTRILQPAIKIVTTGPATAVAGEPVGYTLAVTNPGDTPFLAAYVSTSDALCDAPPLLTSKNGDGTPSQHDPGDTWTYACTVQTQSGQTQVDNIGKATARDSFGGREVTDTDPATTQLTSSATAQPPPLTPKAVPAPAPKPVNPPRLAAPRPPAPATPAVTARLRGPSGCVSRPFRVTVSGYGIARVDFLLDGRRHRRITARGARPVFSIRIDPRRQSKVAHRVSARVYFHPAAKTARRTLRLVYVSCPRHSVPRFTG